MYFGNVVEVVTAILKCFVYNIVLSVGRQIVTCILAERNWLCSVSGMLRTPLAIDVWSSLKINALLFELFNVTEINYLKIIN